MQKTADVYVGVMHFNIHEMILCDDVVYIYIYREKKK